MPELHSAVASGVLLGSVASTATLFLGAQVDALVVGLVAAIFVTIWQEDIDSLAKSASAVLLASLLAAYGSPVAASWVAASVPSLAVNADALRMLMALAIGGASPSAVPIALRFIGRKGGSL